MTVFNLDSARAVLSRTPSTLRALLHDLPREWTEGEHQDGRWSAFEILGHLIQGDLEDWIPRTRHLLSHGEERPFEPFDRSGFERITAGRDLNDLLAAFTDARAASLQDLESLRAGSNLDRTGLHPELGTITLRQMLATWTAHDLSHLGQIADSMARRYRDEVGPWRRYLPVLDRPEEDSG